MGLFDKIKSMKDAVTGGAAKVFVDVSGDKIDQPITITIRAKSAGNEVKYDRVYLQVEGIEEVEVPDTDVIYDEDGELPPGIGTFSEIRLTITKKKKK